MYPIELRKITKSFGELLILNGIDLRLNPGQSSAIIGKSGTGKTTLLQLCGGLDVPTSGTVLLNGTDISGLGDSRMSVLRNRTIGFIFQSNMLLEDFTALENVMAPAMIGGKRKSDCMERAEELLLRMGLKDRCGHFPGKLSGGEKQRVAICRALMNKPDVILADEPTGSLDEENAREVEDMLLSITALENRTLLLVTHNIDFARRCNNIYMLKNHVLTPYEEDR